MMTRARVVWALLASVALHAVPLSAGWATRAFPRSTPAQPAPPEEPEAPAAVWAGETFDIDTLPSGASVGASSLPVAAERPLGDTPPQAARESASPEVDAIAAPPVLPLRPSEGQPEAPPAPSQRKAVAPAAAEESPKGASGAAQSTEAHAAGSGSYGAAGVGALAAPLGKGLLRVLPRAAFVEPIFHELPMGTSVQLRFSVDLDVDGHAVLPLRFDAEQRRIPWLEELLGRAVLLLRGGAFSLPAGVTGPASSSFELELEVVQGVAASGDWAEPKDLAEIGRLIEPTRTQPGRAHFRYNSGREVQVLLRLR